jgi:uncharacterized membrane protein
MILMLAGLALFLGAHVFTTRREARAALIARIGEGPYKGLYSAVSAAGLVLTAYGYAAWRDAGPAQLWEPPVAMRHIALLLMLFASIFAAAAYVPSPYPGTDEASAAGRGEDLGARASAGERRCGDDHAVRPGAGLGGV